MSEMGDNELLEAIKRRAVAEAEIEIANELNEYIDSGQLDKEIDELLIPKSWIGRLWERILGF